MLDINAEPVVIKEGPAFAIIATQNGMGMVASCRAMESVCDKAKQAGIDIFTVKKSSLVIESSSFYVYLT